MREIILNVLSELACRDTNSCQINLQSEAAQIMIADKIETALRPYINEIIEDVACCGSDCKDR
jgi:hypothetical protein